MDLASYRSDFEGADPFPHVVVENFWPDPEALKAARWELEGALPWMRADHRDQQLKMWLSDPAAMPAGTRAIVEALNAPPMIEQLSALTGLELLPDPGYEGGGVHRIFTGGKLGIHADFNLHPKLGWHRRVNLLLYMNPIWEPRWGGELELWSRDMDRCVRKFSPMFNRAVILKIDDTAFHGHPEPLACPPGVSRMSIATYYYTTDRPASEKAPFHWASWQRRPGE